MLTRVKCSATDSVICAEMLSNSSSALWRDMEEGKSRCLIRLGRHQEALDCASQLVCIYCGYCWDDLQICVLYSDVFLFT